MENPFPLPIAQAICTQLQQELEHYTALLAQRFILMADPGSIMSTGRGVEFQNGDKRRYFIVLASGDAAKDLEMWTREQAEVRRVVAEAAGAEIVEIVTPNSDEDDS